MAVFCLQNPLFPILGILTPVRGKRVPKSLGLRECREDKRISCSDWARPDLTGSLLEAVVAPKPSALNPWKCQVPVLEADHRNAEIHQPN